MLNFSRLVEMLYSCHCMQFCALPGTQASSQLTGRGALLSLSGKGDRQDCNNYRGVTLLSVLGKVFAQIILDRVHHHLLEHQRPEQSGFTPKRSTIDRILALRDLTERRREFWQGLLAADVDLCKAFDSVNRDALWRILGLRGVPPKLIDLMVTMPK